MEGKIGLDKVMTVEILCTVLIRARYIPVISTLQRLSLGNCHELEARLNYILSSIM